ncbi:MAG: antibiotic biosynthesis monooxygenase family protein [Dehalococcoidia bacterium]
MSYLRVSVVKWTIEANSPEGDEVVRKVEQEGIPLLRKQPGFLRFQTMNSDSHTSVSVIEWETEQQGQAGVQGWTEWLRSSGAGQQFDGPPQVYTGAVRIAS